MKLSRFTDLSLRVLLILAYLKGKRLATVAEIAEKLKESSPLVIKAVHRLNHEGWIDTIRGRAGGIRLSKEANEYRLGDIIHQLEGGEALVDCEAPLCAFMTNSHIGEYLEDAHKAFYESLNRHTLEEMANSPEMVKIFKDLQIELDPPKRVWRRSLLCRTPEEIKKA